MKVADTSPLARCHEEGWGCERDLGLAADWYRRSAEADELIRQEIARRGFRL